MERDKIEKAMEALRQAGYFGLNSMWHINDILGEAEEMDIDISEAEAKKVAIYIEENFDATVGIDLDVIQNAINEVLYGKE